MSTEKMSKKELEQICVKEGILLERNDIVTNTVFYLPNLEIIKIMVREFNFLVEGAARGKAINEISNIERYLYKHEGKIDLQNSILATNYSQTSIFIESKKDLIDDKNSENWTSILTQYFSLEDIYNYFHKTGGASNFFRKFKIYDEMVELNYKIKIMDYLQSQIEVFIPFDDDQIIPYKIDSLEMKILLFKKMGFLDSLKERMKTDYHVSGAKLLSTVLGKSGGSWKKINEILWDMDQQEENSILKDDKLNNDLREIFVHYNIDMRKNFL